MRAIDFVLTVLLSSLWQAPILALVAWASLRLTRTSTASTRYAVWLFALLAATVAPIVTGAYLTLRDTSPAPVTQPVAPPQTSHPVRNAAPVRVKLPATASSAKTGVALSAPARVSNGIARPRLTPTPQIAYAFGGAWLLVALFLLLKLVIDLLALERLKRDALPLPIEYRDALTGWTHLSESRDVRLCISDRIEVPVAIGLFDAMILLPAHLVETLTPHEIDQIALHELAHLRRADDWSNGFQRVAATLFFFNPAIRWISHQLDLEREVACDDHVVTATQSVRPYAQCLAKMAEVTAWPHRALAAPGVFNTRKSISIRIERLLKTGRNARVSISYPVLTVTTLAALAVVFVALSAGPIIAATAPCPPVAVAQTTPRKIAQQPQRKAQAVKPAVTTYVALPTPVLIAQAQPAAIAAQTPAPKYQQTKATPRPARTARPVSTPRPPRTRAATIIPGTGIVRCSGCSFGGVDWSGRDLRGIVLHGANLADANLTNADLRDADLSGSNLANVRLQGAKLAGAHLAGVNFEGVSLQGVDLSQADISGSNIDVKSLDKATLRVMLTKCKGCNFGDADFRNMDLRGMTITGANFGGTDFRGADLRGTTFNGANFGGAKFGGAHVDQARFVGCNFDEADFRGVDVTHAEFVGSNMSGIIM